MWPEVYHKPAREWPPLCAARGLLATVVAEPGELSREHVGPGKADTAPKVPRARSPLDPRETIQRLQTGLTVCSQTGLTACSRPG